MSLSKDQCEYIAGLLNRTASTNKASKKLSKVLLKLSDRFQSKAAERTLFLSKNEVKLLLTILKEYQKLARSVDEPTNFRLEAARLVIDRVVLTLEQLEDDGKN